MLIHCVLNNDMGDMNKSVMKTVGNITSPRGFFMTRNHIQTYLDGLDVHTRNGFHSCADIALDMGRTYGKLIVFAKIIPLDVEYTLGMQNGQLVMAVMDFGLCKTITSDMTFSDVVYQLVMGDGHTTGLQGDLYIPQEDDVLFDTFLKGVESILGDGEYSTRMFQCMRHIFNNYNDSVFTDLERKTPFMSQFSFSSSSSV